MIKLEFPELWFTATFSVLHYVIKFVLFCFYVWEQPLSSPILSLLTYLYINCWWSTYIFMGWLFFFPTTALFLMNKSVTKAAPAKLTPNYYLNHSVNFQFQFSLKIARLCWIFSLFVAFLCVRESQRACARERETSSHHLVLIFVDHD